MAKSHGTSCLDDVVRAADELAALCRPSFGPCGEETLLFRPPDAPVVTGEGHAVLAAWQRGLSNSSSQQRAHPLAAFLLCAANGVHQQLGDGSSQFILLVDAAVRHAVDSLRRDKGSRHGFDRSQLSRAFAELKWELHHELQTSSSRFHGMRVAIPIEIDAATLQPSVQFCEATANILRSSLHGVFSGNAVDFVVELVIQWVFTTSHTHRRCSLADERATKPNWLFQRIQQFIKRAPDAVIFMAAPSVYGSYVVPHDEFILKKAVVASQSPEMLHRLQEPIRFLCLTCPFSLTAGSNHIELVTTTHEQLFSAEDASRVFIATYTRRLHTQHHIRLIICTESIEDSVIAACTRQGIACVQFAESADVETLCITAGIFSLASLFDEIQAAQHVGVCLNGVSSVRFQQQACLRLRGLAKSDIQTELRSPGHQPFVVIPQLLIHAPTKGVYKQYYAAIFKALRVLRSWWELSESPAITIDDSPRPRQNSGVVYCCRGGGSAELAIARWLQDGGGEGNSKLRAADAAVASLARQILANALLEVVAVLRTNLSSTCSNDNEEGINPRQCSQRRVLLEVFSNQSSGNQPLEIRGYVLDFTNVLHTMAGPIDVPELVLVDPKAYGLVHPWKRLETLVFLVAQTLEQLLRIDAVLRTADTPETGD